MESKPVRGGKRPGAGRPSHGSQPMAQCPFTLPRDLLDEITEMAVQQGVSRSHLIVQALSAYVATHR